MEKIQKIEEALSIIWEEREKKLFPFRILY